MLLASLFTLYNSGVTLATLIYMTLGTLFLDMDGLEF
jgi:hypothetical protein